MAAQPPPAGSRPPLPAPPTPLSELRPDVHPLGEALLARVTDVLALTTARTKHPGVDPEVQARYEQINRRSTIALGRWLAGEGPSIALQAGKEASSFYGELAVRRAASLHEVTTRTLAWRDAMAQVLQDSTVQLQASPEALSQALNVLQVSVEFSLVGMSRSFDVERQRTDAELAFMATHDALTGLPNRTLMLDRLGQMLARAARARTAVAALSINIDNLKSVTDTLGHAASDELLRAVAARLDGVARGSDALGCFGGHEFLLICDEFSAEAGPERTAERLLEALKAPFKLGENEGARFTADASIGVAVGVGAVAEELLREADIAMYQAKWEAKHGYVVFEPGMREAVRTRTELEMDLRNALPNGEFFLVYQPTFKLSDMTATGVEALLRWRHSARGVVQPNDFIPLLEATELIIDVGAWVLKQACRQGAAWRAAGHAVGMAVNVSGRQLDSDDFVTDVRDALAESGLEPTALTLEVTETTLMSNIEETARRLAVVRELGVRIAIDDFGTGYSSLAHLQQLPIDALKIDRSFTSRLTENPEGEALIHTVVQLGKALSIETLAEGIEQRQELSMLQDEQCDSGQGFLFARPLEAADAETFLQTWPETAARDLPRAA